MQFVVNFVSSIELQYHVSLRREGDMVKLAIPGHRPITLERLSKTAILIGHTFDQRHNLVRDPEFLIHTDRNRWTPVSLRRGDHVMKAVDLDDQDRIIQVDSVKVVEIEEEMEKFVGRLREKAWWNAARMVMSTPSRSGVEAIAQFGHDQRS